MTARSMTGAEAITSIAGSVRVQEADQFADSLKDLLVGAAPVVTLDVGQVESVDVTFFQVLLAFQLSLARQNRSLLVRGLGVNDHLRETAELLGLNLNHQFTLFEEKS